MRRLIATIGAATMILVSTGCSSGPSQSAAPATAAASTEASVVASSEPSSEAPSEAAASASIPLPQFSFPSDDKELEALIPDTLCGAKAQKLSLKGSQAIGSADVWSGILTALGKSVSDVSAAAGFVAEGAVGCSVTIIRIKGADEGALRQLAQQEAAKEGKTYTQVSLGGKDIFRTDPAKFEYAYVKGDGVIIVLANSEANAATIISALP